MKKIIATALAAFVSLGATAQSADSRPSERDAQQARANAKRDQQMADTMEKARLKEEAKPVSAYIPKEEPQAAIKDHHPEVFTAGVPGAKKKAAKKTAAKKKKEKEQAG